MPVHLYGHPANMPEIMAIAQKHGLMVFEDAAQAHAASIDGAPVGSFGTFAAFSFYPTKNMTTGEGGMIVTADPELEQRLASCAIRAWSDVTRTSWSASTLG